MSISRMTKPELISELEKRLLPTSGLKEELKCRLIEAIEKENSAKGEREKNSIQVDDENIDQVEIERVEETDNIKGTNASDEKFKDAINETLNEDEIIIGADQSTVLTEEDAIKMKASHEVENYSSIVNLNEDDVDNDSISNSPNDDNVNSIQTNSNNNRELDNGDHEIIEISEEVVIDDEDNQENDNNYNDISSDSNQLQSRDVGNEMGKTESRKEDLSKPQVKTEIWVSNIAEDVKAVELKELFGKFGKVISAKVVMNAKNPSGSCFGCIQLASTNDAKACMSNLDQTEFRGNIISITNDISDKVSKEKIIRNVSPTSSSASWGSKKNLGDKLSLSPALSAPSVNKTKNDSFEKDKRSQYREKQSAGSGFYRKEFPDRVSMSRRANKPQYDDRRMDFSDRPSSKPYYKPSTYGNSYSSNDTRSRDMFPRREGRENYNSQYDMRYSAVSRDRPSTRNDYPDKLKPCYDYRSSRPNKYESYDDYDRRDKRPVYDRPSREIDSYQSSNKRDLYKRSRPEETDDYFHSKKRRTDLITERPHYYHSFDSPKRSYYPEKEFRKPEYKSRRDEYGLELGSKSDRDFFPVRRTIEYSNRREGYDGYSPDRHTGRSNHYSKEPYLQHSTDFGGRSRRY